MSSNDQHKYNLYYSNMLKQISQELHDYITCIDTSADYTDDLKNEVKLKLFEILRKLKNPLQNLTLSNEENFDIIFLDEFVFKKGNSSILNYITQRFLKSEFGKKYAYYCRAKFPYIVHDDNKSWIKMNEHVSRNITGKTQREILFKYYLPNSLEILIGLGIVLDRQKYKNNIKIIRNNENDDIIISINNVASKFYIKDGKILFESNVPLNPVMLEFFKVSPIFDKQMYTQLFKEKIIEVHLNDEFFKGTVVSSNIEQISLEEIISSIKVEISTKQEELRKVKSRERVLKDDISEMQRHLENIVVAASSINNVKKYLR